MKSLTDLLENRDEMWSRLQGAIKDAKVSSLLAPVDPQLAEETLFALQVPAGNMLGSVVLNTGGLALHDGKLRILGSPARDGQQRNLLDWNADLGLGVDAGLLLVADDVAGNFFGVNLGAIEKDQSTIGAVFALCPAFLEWAIVADRYSDFIIDLFDDFWLDILANNGLSEADFASSSQGDDELSASYYPPLFTKEGGVGLSDMRMISAKEAYEAASALRSALR